ncbi:MAG: hypothetical protein QNJ14_07030 [Woeseiaceae bacterium]|nr:hypothetical protein [Woeseiaceae bacterium]
MRITRSAGAFLALGATLVVVATSANAASAVGKVSSFGGGHAQSITANDVQSITANDVQSITANDVQSITANDVQSITANDVLSITANDALSITANDGQSITANDALSITANDVLIATDMVVAGPVDRIDRINGVFESMGQVVLASQDMLAGMSVGDFVSVEGSVVSPGWLYADTLDVSSTPYVPGATQVFVTGMLSSVDKLAGTAEIGGLIIDFTPSLSGGETPSGTMWSFAGIRPTADGAMLSDRSIGIR